jgi:hypothetical protein
MAMVIEGSGVGAGAGKRLGVYEQTKRGIGI